MLNKSNVNPNPQACRQCGCTENRACPGGCFWVFSDLCSACVFKALAFLLPSLPLAVQEAVLDPLEDISADIIGRLDAADGIGTGAEEPALPRLWQPGDPLEVL